MGLLVQLLLDRLAGRTPPLPAKLDLDFPGRYQNRTVMQGLVNVPAGGAGQSSLGEHPLLRPAAQRRAARRTASCSTASATSSTSRPTDGGAGATLPLVFQRFLRPGDYTLIVKVEDINSGKAFREERTITVPASDRVAPAPPPTDPDAASAALLQEANAAISTGETTLKLVRPFGELQTGMQRFDTLSTGATSTR